MNPKLKQTAPQLRTQVFPALALSYWAAFPAMTFFLLWLKGLPTVAQDHVGLTVLWTYEVTWIPAAFAGILTSIFAWVIVRRTLYFHYPYDFGRCFSLGAVTGALFQALVTWLYRLITRHPFSDFWIAGAMIAGCLTGAILTAFYLRRATLTPKA